MLNSRSLEIFPISLRDVEVRSITDITPHLRRIVFGGEQLAGYTMGDFEVPPFTSVGFDDDIRIVFPDPETGQRPAPGVLGTGSLSWPAEIKDLFRTYTVRAFDEEQQLLTVDFARHTAGVAENWCAQAKVGDRVYVVGPKMSHSLPADVDAVVLVGDETAVPAIARALEELAEGHGGVAVRALLWGRSAAHAYPVDHGAGASVRWLDASAGDDLAAAFETTLAALVEQGVAPGRVYAWIAGEAGENKALRAVAKKAGIEKTHLEVTGYWRASSQSAAKGPGQSAGALARLRELVDVTDQLVFRAALSLNLFPALSAQPRPVDDVAAEIGVVPERLVRLCRYLHSLEVVEYVPAAGDGPATVATTPLSRELSDPDSRLVELFTSVDTLSELTLAGLPQAVRGGGPVPLPGFGGTVAELLATDEGVAARAAARAATQASWVAPAVADALNQILGEAPTVAVQGPGAGVYADDITRKLSQSQVHLAGTRDAPPVADAGRAARIHTHTTDLAEGLGDADAVLLIDPFASSTDEELAHLITAVAHQAGVPLFIACDLVEDTGGDAHDYGHDLVAMCAHGASIPTAGDVARLVAAAGCVVADARHVGWGKRLITVRRA